MYRLLMLSCVVGWAVGQCRQDWFWPGGHGDDDDYNDGSSGGNRRVELSVAAIARKLRSAGDLMDGFCTAHSDRNLREVYGINHFKLIVSLPEYSAENIRVKVQNRLVLIHAQDCESKYAAVRVLPDVVEAASATWRLQGGVLTVQFPYNITPDTDLRSRCGSKPNGGVITVPQSSTHSPQQPDYDLLLGDPEFRRAIMKYLRRHEGNMGGPTEDKGINEYVDDDEEPAR